MCLIIKPTTMQQNNKSEMIGNREIYISNGTKTTVTHGYDSVYVLEEQFGSPFKITRVYSAKTGFMTLEGKTFHGMEVSISRWYDENGNFQEEFDFDKNYPLTVEKLIYSMKMRYGIDLLCPGKLLEIKRVDLGNPYEESTWHDVFPAFVVKPKNRHVYYVSFFHTNKQELDIDVCFIDGCNGEIIFKEIIGQNC